MDCQSGVREHLADVRSQVTRSTIGPLRLVTHRTAARACSRRMARSLESCRAAPAPTRSAGSTRAAAPVPTEMQLPVRVTPGLRCETTLEADDYPALAGDRHLDVLDGDLIGRHDEDLLPSADHTARPRWRNRSPSSSIADLRRTGPATREPCRMQTPVASTVSTSGTRAGSLAAIAERQPHLSS